MKRCTLIVALGLFTSASVVAIAGCDEGGAVKETVRAPDSGAGPGQDAAPMPGSDGGALPDGAPSDCVQNPKTHEEIINGCTDSVKITKKPTLPLLLPDGALPPLP